MSTSCEGHEPKKPEPTITTMSAQEVADLLGIHRTSVYEAANRGEIPSRRVGRRFVFVREVILEWLLAPSERPSEDAGEPSDAKA